MKKYKLTKITVKTREIISVAGSAAPENHSAVCPVCHAPLSTALLSADESPAITFPVRKTIELPAISNDQEEQS